MTRTLTIRALGTSQKGASCLARIASQCYAEEMSDDRELAIGLAELAVASDFQLGSARSRFSEAKLSKLAGTLSQFDFPLVYTAFDGDHFALTDRMRTYCLNRELIPIHPESILGYFETVITRFTKRGVLRDDLALLRRCDQIMIFTDLAPKLQTLADLAEGVLVELCFFMLSNGGGKVSFAPLASILHRDEEDPITIDWSISDVMDALGPRLRHEILGYLGGEDLSIADSLPDVAYAIADILDSKYYRWIRPYTMREFDTITVVPGLAIDVSDCLLTRGGLSCLVVSWIHLMKLASQAFVLDPMNKHHGIGNVYEILRFCWDDGTTRGPLSKLTWEQLSIPKAVLGDEWPISSVSR
jgi:hypothetical protein